MSMDDEIERLVVSVRADTASFARDVASMRGELEGPLVSGAGRAGRLIDNALARAITTGKLGFDDLKKVALSAMAEIARASLRSLCAPSKRPRLLLPPARRIALPRTPHPAETHS